MDTHIKILTVPDERLEQFIARDESGEWIESENGMRLLTDGDLAIVDGVCEDVIPADWKPALLAALLEQAGAVKVRVDNAGRIEGPVLDSWIPVYGERGSFWLLPVKDGGHTMNESKLWILHDAQGWFYRGFFQAGLSLWDFDVSVANSALATRFESVHEAYKAAQHHGGCMWYAILVKDTATLVDAESGP